jgi:hypothetical protein
MMRVVMHTRSHRGQCAARLRALPTPVFYRPLLVIAHH